MRRGIISKQTPPPRVVTGRPLTLAAARRIVKNAGYASALDFDTSTVTLDSGDCMTVGEFIWYAMGISRYAPEAVDFANTTERGRPCCESSNPRAGRPRAMEQDPRPRRSAARKGNM